MCVGGGGGGVTPGHLEDLLFIQCSINCLASAPVSDQGWVRSETNPRLATTGFGTLAFCLNARIGSGAS